MSERFLADDTRTFVEPKASGDALHEDAYKLPELTNVLDKKPVGQVSMIGKDAS